MVMDKLYWLVSPYSNPSLKKIPFGSLLYDLKNRLPPPRIDPLAVILPVLIALVVVAPLSVTESNVSVSANEVAVMFVKLLPSP